MYENFDLRLLEIVYFDAHADSFLFVFFSHNNKCISKMKL